VSLPSPTDIQDVTPAWLTEALDARHPGVRVAAVEQLGRTTATNLHLRLGLTYEVRAGAPDSLFVKLPPLDSAHSQAIGAFAMGEREARFYADVAPLVALRVPTAHHVGIDDDGAFVLLLEDLVATGCSISDGTWAIPGDLAAGALVELAEMHARFEDDELRHKVVPWASERPPTANDFTLRTLRRVVDEHRDELSEAYVAVAELYLERHAEMSALWDRGPHTLVHGDAHIGNVFVDGRRVGFFDWGLAKISTPMWDVSYFLTMAVDPDDRRSMQRDLLQHYLDARRSHGGTDITFDEAWLTHRTQSAYTVIASFLGLVPPYNAPAVRPFGTAFRERSMQALDDLETVAALREVLA
jgi:hypothetical protein